MGNAGSTWLHNNNEGTTQYQPSSTDLNIVGTYVAGIAGVMIILHGFYLYRYKFDSTRLLCDLAASASILASLLTYIALRKPTSASQVAVLYNCLSDGVCVAVVQLCDCYLFYTRFLAIQRVTKLQRMVIHSFIWIALIGTWLPTLTIVPFFCDTNSEEYYVVIVAMNYIYALGCLSYNFYFTFRCCWILRQIVYSKYNTYSITAPNVDIPPPATAESGTVTALPDPLITTRSTFSKQKNMNSPQRSGDDFSVLEQSVPSVGIRGPLADSAANALGSTSTRSTSEKSDGTTAQSYSKWKLGVIAIKSIGHACTSSLAALLSTWEPTGVGYALWTVLIIVGMHLWFNVHLEHYVCPYKQRRIHAMNRDERELVMRQRQLRKNVPENKDGADIEEEEEEEEEEEKSCSEALQVWHETGQRGSRHSPARSRSARSNSNSKSSKGSSSINISMGVSIRINGRKNDRRA
jgi:hypothetical protein